MKKLVSILLVFAVLISAFSTAVIADDDDCAKVELKGNTLTISFVKEHEPSYSYVKIDLEDYGIDESTIINKLVIGEGFKKLYVYTPVVINDVYLPSMLETVPLSDCINYHVNEKNEFMEDIDGVLFSKDGKTLLMYGDGRKAESYTVPEGTESIKHRSFSNEYLKEVIFPDSVKTIDNLEGWKCLENVVLPDSLEHINVSGLKETKWYKSGDMRIVGDGILIGPCKDRVLKTPEGCKQIAEGAFAYQEFDSIIIGGSVKKVNSRAFSMCHTDNLIIEEGVKELGVEAFYNISGNDDHFYPSKRTWIKSVVLPRSIEKIGSASFFEAKIEKLYIPDNFDKTMLNDIMKCYVYADLYVERESEAASLASERGILVFDYETGEAILPTDGSLKVTRILAKDVPDTIMDQVGEPIEFKDKKPFQARGDIYVPLRFMCELYGVDIVWNEDLKAAEVGTRLSGVTRMEKTVSFGDEGLVIYNGETLPGQISDMMPGGGFWFKPDHSAVNIDGCIYVPMRDFIEGTSVARLRHFVYSINPIIVEG